MTPKLVRWLQVQVMVDPLVPATEQPSLDQSPLLPKYKNPQTDIQYLTLSLLQAHMCSRILLSHTDIKWGVCDTKLERSWETRLGIPVLHYIMFTR